jgi:CDP-diacylglycerol--glycerol-3-phosphate 3-phosphatidyltransferase
MNFTHEIIKVLAGSQVPTEVLCSAPESNSFYRGGFLKKYIPYFYRNFEGMILEKWGDKFKFK